MVEEKQTKGGLKKRESEGEKREIGARKKQKKKRMRIREKQKGYREI